ncbi:MAG: hypothetical protein WC700_14175 [Gemmatimonadaceae bacterium]
MFWILPVLFLSSAVAAQDPRAQQPRMPESFTPPSGLCRLWISGVPASQQPAPTDCASAIRNRPSNASVVFGPQRRDESREMRPFTGRAGQSPTRRLVPEDRPMDARQPDARQPDVRSAETRQPEARPVQPREEVRSRPPDRAPEPAVKAVKRKPEKPQ